MEIKKCMGCMRDSEEAVCPHCGFSLSQYQKPANALDCGSILNARYLLGAAKETASSLRYSAFDLELEKSLEIVEFFPAAQAERSCGSAVQWSTNSADSIKRFETAARKAPALNAVQSLCHVRDVFSENGTCYCATDKWFGKSLKETVQQSGPLKWKQAQKIFADAAKTMQAVHDAGFAHCNLNPENLILTEKGIVIRLDPASLCELSGGSHRHLIVQEKEFSAPELFTPSEAIGTWTDVYSLAAALFFALTGTLPPAVQSRVTEDTLSFEAPVFQKLPHSAVQMLKEALELEPEDRTETMIQLLSGISKKSSADPAAPKPGSKKRNKLWIGVAAAVLVVAAGGVTTSRLIKSSQYKSAEEAYLAGDYVLAAAMFEDLSGYKDSEEMAQTADGHIHFEAGMQAKQEQRYADAVTEFTSAPGVPGVDEQLGESYMLLGQEHLENEFYQKALEAFSEAEKLNFKDADVYSAYADGMKDLLNKDYPAAIEKLTKNTAVTKDLKSPAKAYGDYVKQLLDKGEFETAEKIGTEYTSFCTKNKCDAAEAKQLVNGAILSQAEALYDTGYLADALTAFRRASEGAVYNGIDREERLKKLEKHAKLMDIEGDWHTVSGKSTLSSGGWVYYYDLDAAQPLPFSIRFVLNDDDTITAAGSCTWLSCANRLTINKETFDFSSDVSLNYLHLKGVEGIKQNVSITYYSDTLKVGFTSEDGTSVQYTYAKGK